MLPGQPDKTQFYSISSLPINKAPSGFMQNPFKDSISLVNDPMAYPGKVLGGLSGFYAGATSGAEFGMLLGEFAGPLGLMSGALIGGVSVGILGAFGGKYLGGNFSSWALPKLAEVALDSYKNSMYYRDFYRDGQALANTVNNINNLSSNVNNALFKFGAAIANGTPGGISQAYDQLYRLGGGLSDAVYVVRGTLGKTRDILNKPFDPFLLDLSGNNKIDLIGLSQSHVLFDMDVDGLLNRTAWVSNGDGMLVLDKNSDGIINDLSEVFSEHFDPRANSALEALKLYDSNYDHIFNSADAKWNDVKVWIDSNSNGITDSGELKTLAELGITKIDLNAATVSIEDEHGNITQGITSATKNGQNIRAEEVALLVNTTDFSLDKTENNINFYKGSDGSVLGVAADSSSHTVDLATSKIDAFIGNSGNDNISTTGKAGVAIDGGAGDDVITGGIGDDILVGGDGADSLRGGAGDDTLFVDSADAIIDGGEGSDTIFLVTNSGMTFDAGLHNIETVFGGDGADVISTSTAGAVTFFGGEGNDTLSGNTGDDSFDGSAGNDSINGGAGMDTTIYSGKKSDYTITQNGSSWSVTDNRNSEGIVNSGTDILTNIERIRFDDEVIHTDNSNNNPIVVGGKMAVRNLDSLTITSAELLGTATDKDGDYLTVVGIGKVVGGKASLDKDGNVIFTPREGFSGKASFEYTVDDGHGGRASGTAEIVVKPDVPTDNLFDQQWYLKAANIVPVWDDYIGRGVKIGIVDDGITSHSDLPNIELIKMNYPHPNPNPGGEGTSADAFLGDAGTHGTFLAGLIGGLKNGSGMVGVAYGGLLKAYVAYGDTAFDRQEEVDVSSNSWMFNAGGAGTIYSTEPSNIKTKLEKAVHDGRGGKGTVIVASAGNVRQSHENTNNFDLANSRYAITVGAVDSLGKYTPFSTPGANVHVVAPGADITSTDRVGADGYSTGSATETWGKDAHTSKNEKSVSGENTQRMAVPNDETGIYSQIEIKSGLNIDQVEVELDLADSDLRDLQVTLISPDGTRSILIDKPSLQGNGTVKFTLSSGHFLGESGVGVWTLQVIDKNSGDKAVLNSWKLNLYGDEISDNSTYVYANEYGRFVEAVANDNFKTKILKLAA